MPNLIERMAIPTCKDYLDIIERRAIDIWSEKYWRAEIARKYAEVARENGDSDATYETRRRQIYRVFDEGKCTPETLFMLAACVDCEFQMACKTIYRVGQP